METITLSIDAINEEIGLCQQVLEEFEEEYNRLQKKSQLITNRLKVLQAVGEKLTTGGTKALNDANINLVVEERNSIIREFHKQQSNINHYKKILESLYEVKKDYLKI